MRSSVTYNNDSLYERVKESLHTQLVIRKFNSPLGISLLAFVALAIVLAVQWNILAGIGLIAGLLGITAVMICLFDSRLGLYISCGISFFVFYVNRMVGDILPVGVVSDILIAITFVGLYFRKTALKSRFWTLAHSAITYVYLLFTVFLIVEAFNPSMHNIQGWIFGFRKFLNFLMIYFVGLHVFKTFDDVKEFFMVWIGLAFFCGFYGCFQEWVGLLPFEEHWVTSDPRKYALYFQGGTIRKWSFLSDPTSFGIRMANTIIFALILAMGPVSKKLKRYLVIGSIFMALGMAYSGTRTAYAMIPVGVILYILMTITSRKTLLVAIGFVMLFAGILFAPIHSNGTINRIRSAFTFSEDDSYNIRDVNRHMIQPYIWSHPIGGGVTTSGVAGEIYNPGHTLAGFPTDSGLLKSAVETGWLGLTLTLLIQFIVMQQCIHAYYRSRKPMFRVFYVGIAATTFSLLIGNYAQDAIGQIPGCFLYFCSLSAIVRLQAIEKEEKESVHVHPNNKTVLS